MIVVKQNQGVNLHSIYDGVRIYAQKVINLETPQE